MRIVVPIVVEMTEDQAAAYMAEWELDRLNQMRRHVRQRAHRAVTESLKMPDRVGRLRVTLNKT